MGDVLDCRAQHLQMRYRGRGWSYPYESGRRFPSGAGSSAPRPEYVGALRHWAWGVPDELEVARLSHVRAGLEQSPVRFDPESQRPLPPRLAERFGIKSMIAMGGSSQSRQALHVRVAPVLSAPRGLDSAGGAAVP